MPRDGTLRDPWTWLLDPVLTPVAPRVIMPASALSRVAATPIRWGSAVPVESLRVTATEPLSGSTTRPIRTPPVPRPTAAAPVYVPEVRTAPAPTYTTYLPEVRAGPAGYTFYDTMSEGMGEWKKRPGVGLGAKVKVAPPVLPRSAPGGSGGGTGTAPLPGEVVPGGVSEGGGGGTGGGGGGVAPGAVPDMLGELAWWANADTLQPLLRGWGGWLKELIEQNRLTQSIPNPFATIPEAEAAGVEVAEATAPAAAGYQTSRGVVDRLKTLLGVQFEEGETSTSQWQKVINAIPKADFEAQQLLASLRFDPTGNQWYSVDIGALVNPKYT